jgi:hypothetical protein
MPFSSQDDSAVLLRFHKDSVEAIHAALEAQGGEIAKKSRELRALYRHIIGASSGATQQSGFFVQFEFPIDAILTYLFIQKEPCSKKKIIEDIAAGGFQGRGNGAEKAIRDSVDYQTNKQNNGKKRLFVDDIGNISLTVSGEQEARKILATLPKKNEPLAPSSAGR